MSEAEVREALFEKLYEKTAHDVKRELLRVMKELEVHRVEAEYSGGHDEGGVQNLVAHDASGEVIELELESSGWEHPLWAACDAVLSTKFFSWALGHSVDGTLYVDMGEKRVWTSGQIEDWVPDTDPIEWKL